MKYFLPFLFVLSFGFASSFLSSCSNSDEEADIANRLDEVSVTSKFEILDYSSAKLWAYANGATGKIGICISPTNNDPKLENSTVLETASISSDHSYYVTANGLHPSTVYYYRAFAHKDELVYYAKDVKSFYIDHKGEAIDLGLSVKWASCNVGAVNPEDSGNEYAWGETWVKDVYDYDTYTESLLKKYSLGTEHILDLSDDAVNKNWGGKWRLPSIAEVQELIDNCTVTKTFNGYKIESNINKNYIIVPNGAYWTNELRTHSTHSSGFAWRWYFWKDKIEFENENNGTRESAHYVRGVHP